MKVHSDVFRLYYIKVLFILLLELEPMHGGESIFVDEALQSHEEIIRNFFDRRKYWQTSNLGSILFKISDENEFGPKNRTFKVLIWRYWGHDIFHSVYHLQSFTDPLTDCNVKNCEFSGGVNATGFDAVVVNISNVHLFNPPVRNQFDAQQIWVWMSEDPPVQTEANKSYYHVAGCYNWSMSYRTDSEVPIPAGRTIPLLQSYTDDLTNIDFLSLLVPNWIFKKRDVLAAAMISQCDLDRMAFLTELQEYMIVDVYGNCSNDISLRKSCFIPESKSYKINCEVLNNYTFHIILETSRCRQYISEQVFNAYANGAIPVIRGAPLYDLENLLPPYSFISIDNYMSVKELAGFLQRISLKEELLMYHHRWRNNFEVIVERGLEEHGIARNVPFCRVCEALNYNEYGRNVYDEDDIQLFLEPRILCEGFPY